MVVGLAAGGAASALDWILEFGSDHLVGRFSHVATAEIWHLDLAVLLLPAAGGLVAGLAVWWLAAGSGGHGVAELTRAFHHGLGALPFRPPAIKAGGTALVMSCGGSAGPEGPIAALGAGAGSTLGRLFGVRPHERRILLLAGCAAGIGAIFRCPLGGALFATSIIYSEPEFESDAIVSSFIASVIGYTSFVFLRGYEGPMLANVESLRFVSPSDLAWYAMLGLICGLAAIFFYCCLHVVEARLVPRLHWPTWCIAALGGLLTGAVACLMPQVMDGRYVFLQNALDGTLLESASDRSWLAWAGFFALVALAKCVATGLTVGSGCPGGVLGPSVFIGGAVGAALGSLGYAFFPETFGEPLRQALIPVAMAGVLAATMRTPLAAIVMVTEMTGSYGLIAPLMLVCGISYVVAQRWGMNDQQVPTAAESPAHAADALIHLLEKVPVRQLMQSRWPMVVARGAGLDTIIEKIEPGSRPAIAVAEQGRLLGLITATDLGHVLASPDVSRMLVASDIMTRSMSTVRPDDNIYTALEIFKQENHDVLPVVTAGSSPAWVGMLTRQQVVDHLRRQIKSDQDAVSREHAGLSAIAADMHLDHLLVGVPTHESAVQQLFVPIQAVNKSLRECDFRKQFNAQVISIIQADGSIQCPPDIDAPLKTEQRLMVVVWKQNEDDDA